MTIFVGYDSREHDAFRVCARSIEDLSTATPVQLRSTNIPEYKRDWGEPQSTDFTFTRFLSLIHI